MNSPRAMRATASVSVRPNRRIWVSVNGKVITINSSAMQPAQTHKVGWKAYVIEAATGKQVDAYPQIEGEDTLSVDANEAEREVKRIYIDRCQYADKPVDLSALKDHTALSEWDIHVEITEPETAQPTH